ncbi:MAG: hypothetical protein KJ826_14600 [Proteobacteria bacterium]|nr:hypothetical protein [Pseudomonadota bacterium]
MAEKKNWTEIFLIPLVLAVVGILGTHFITQQQERNAQAKADSDRQVKILEIFAEKVTSSDEQQRLLALKLLRAVDDDLAAKLASAVAEVEPLRSKVGEVATEVATEARARIELLPRIYIHVKGNDERESARSVVQLLETEQFVVPGVQRVGSKLPKVSQLRYFKKTEEDEAKRILLILSKAGYKVSPEYIAGYEASKAIRPMHFEL